MAWNSNVVSAAFNTPVFGGFGREYAEVAKDDTFSKALGQIKAQNVANEMLLASEALKGAWQKQINDDTIAYNLQVMNNTNKQERRRMAGLLLGGLLTSASAGRARQSPEQRANDLLQLMANVRSFGGEYANQLAGVGTAALTRVGQQPG